MPSERYGERPTERKSRVVIDTGVLISAFVFGGVPEKAVKKAFVEADLYISLALLKEYREVPLALQGRKDRTASVENIDFRAGLDCCQSNSSPSSKEALSVQRSGRQYAA
jgi:hypothetical protein